MTWRAESVDELSMDMWAVIGRQADAKRAWADYHVHAERAYRFRDLSHKHMHRAAASRRKAEKLEWVDLGRWTQ